jgi:hypothetical protein
METQFRNLLTTDNLGLAFLSTSSNSFSIHPSEED